MKRACLFAICAAFPVIPVNCNWTRCSRLAEIAVVDCSGQRFDVIFQNTLLFLL